MDSDFEEQINEGIHPDNLVEKTPASIMSIVSLASEIFSAYGWIILFTSVLSWFLWRSFKKKYESFKESADHYKNPEKFILRENALQEARKRMQEEYEEKARERARKLEEEKEKRKVNSNSKETSSSCNFVRSEDSESSNSKPKKSTTNFRPEYNPLMSDTRSCRPSWGRRRAGGG